MVVDCTLPPSEEEVGISLYLDDSNGDHISLPCLFKHRFQDFHVYEIPQGSSSPVHLTKLWTKDKIIREIREKKDKEEDLQNALGPEYHITDKQLQAIEATLTEEDKDRFISFLKTPRNDTAPKYCLLDGSTIQDKLGRTRVHELVKTQFPQGLFITDTVDPTTDNDNKHQIRVWIKKDFTIGQKRARELAAAAEEEKEEEVVGSKSKKRRRRDGKRGRNKGRGISGDHHQHDEDLPQARYDPWPKDQPDYLYFNMYKENRDTAQAISSIARAMGKKNTKAFTVAGTKDRRGCTVQQVCMWRTYIDQLKRAMLSGHWDKFTRLSDFHYSSQKLSLGMLYGNRFYVALRGIKDCPNTDDLDRAFNALSTKGFINYFGMQRFGTQLTRTYQIGQAMIAGHWQKAVRLIMGESNDKALLQHDEEVDHATMNDDENTHTDMSMDAARRAYLIDNDPVKSLKLMPRMMHIERKIMTLLAKDPNGYLAALQQLPTPTLSLKNQYQLQSFIWNHAVSHRISTYGPTIVVGDIVLSTTTTQEEDIETDEPHSSYDDNTTTTEDGLDRSHDDDDSENCGEQQHSKEEREVVHITCDNISSYSIYDVVLPLPGDNTQYPINMNQWYEDFTMKELGLSLQDLKSCRSSGGVFNLPGSYRNILEKAEDVEYELIQPEMALNRTLIPTDIDNITKRDYTEEKLNGDKDKAVLEGTYSIVFKTTLKSGTYLTMALRELTRQDTSRNSMQISDSIIQTNNK